MGEPEQYALLTNEKVPTLKRVMEALVDALDRHEQPSAWDIVDSIERELGWKARWFVKEALNELKLVSRSTKARRSFLDSLIESGDLAEALRGLDAPKKEIASSIDSLLRNSKTYQSSEQFGEMVTFMARFRDYAPYNNMLVCVQNPTCSFYATEQDWKSRFERRLKEDARPMLILAPMHPVMVVYALDETEGRPLPAEINNFSHFEGQWDPRRLDLTIDNAKKHDLVQVQYKSLSSTSSGFATCRSKDDWKMRIAIHEKLDEPSRYGVLCHELAHIYLGHLGSDSDHWWPSRSELTLRTVEIEAEAVAFIVTTRLGLQGSSASYVCRYLGRHTSLPPTVSLDHVAKVAAKIEKMGEHKLAPRKKGKSPSTPSILPKTSSEGP
jgi:hypothetical protein